MTYSEHLLRRVLTLCRNAVGVFNTPPADWAKKLCVVFLRLRALTWSVSLVISSWIEIRNPQKRMFLSLLRFDKIISKMLRISAENHINWNTVWIKLQIKQLLCSTFITGNLSTAQCSEKNDVSMNLYTVTWVLCQYWHPVCSVNIVMLSLF